MAVAVAVAVAVAAEAQEGAQEAMGALRSEVHAFEAPRWPPAGFTGTDREPQQDCITRTCSRRAMGRTCNLLQSIDEELRCEENGG